MKKSPQLEKEMPSTRKRSNLQAKTKHPRNSFENAGNQLTCILIVPISLGNWSSINKIQFRDDITASCRVVSLDCVWDIIRLAIGWMFPRWFFVGSCVENLILYFPQIWLTIRYLDGGNDLFTCLKPNRINRELWTVKKLPWMNTL